ncbi:MmcQ/YjbR family DNA-binding protein [Paraglaciecola mesophila]|nr:MmcQ/YjbR family DNA-binding protein [Paraglaciecola mesophila]
MTAFSIKLTKNQAVVKSSRLVGEKARQWLLDFPETIEDFPFGPDVAVYKVKGKMFATLAFGAVSRHNQASEADDKQEYRMNLKCDPQEAIMLRDVFSAVLPGYHMNKQHWNTVILDGSLPEGELQRMILNSYKLVVNKLPKKEQMSLLLHL